MGPTNRPLDLEWLEDFVALADSGNFTRAAETRAIAQPAFSRHIRALEEWAGFDLFDRSTHPVSLTAGGARLFPLVKDIIAALEAARIKARTAHENAAGSLRFASTHTLSLTFFPRWLASLESDLHIGAIRTMTDHLQACEDLMTQRRAQFMLSYGHPAVASRIAESDFPMIKLDADTLIPVCLAKQDGSPLYDWPHSGPIPLLEYSEMSGLGKILRTQLADVFSGMPGLVQPSVSVVFTTHNAMLLKSMVSAGRGIAWLPRAIVAAELQARTLCAIGPRSWRLPIEIRLYRQKAEMAPVAESLWRIVAARYR